MKDNHNPKKQIKNILKVIKYVLVDYKIVLLFVIIAVFVSSVITVLASVFIKSLIDDYIMPLVIQNSHDFSNLAHALTDLVILLIISTACSYMYARLMVVVTQGTMRKIRDTLFTHMETLPIKYFDTHKTGDIMSVYTNDVDTLRQLISQTLIQFSAQLIRAIATFISMLYLYVPLTIITGMMAIIMFIITKKLSVYSSRYFMAQQKSLGELNAYIEEMMNGQKVVKVFCHEQKAIERFAELNHSLRDNSINANKITNIIMPINGNLSNISYVLCALVGAILAMSGNAGLTIGTLIAFLNMNKSFLMPLAQISNEIQSIVLAGAGAERIFTLMDEKSEVDDGNVILVNIEKDANGNIIETDKKTDHWAFKKYRNGQLIYNELKGDVVFNDVDFGYDENNLVLHDIKIYATPGQKIALVGSTGAGKTTITNLLNRFYDIQDGKIRYDDNNINHIKKKDLRKSLGIVLQDTHLFKTTVMENIRYGKLDATDEECINAAKLSNADEFIKKLPEGYNTVLLADGSNLSQGQRQLLAIARAAIADPPVLILDEATSSIDTRTERLVQDGMDKLMKGRTTFVIAHRLSTVKNADCIMVMEKGRIIERGNHEELIEKKGRYYQLYTGNKAS